MPAHPFTVNGETATVDMPADRPLLWVLRDVLGIRGPRDGCGIDVCKACTPHLDGAAVRPCVVAVSRVADHEVTAIEGLADGDRLHPVQHAWPEHDVARCGYCRPGQTTAAVALPRQTAGPADEDIDQIPNVCRCGTYSRLRQAIQCAQACMRAP
ncbi:(2Fe-2S)-binding protein [Streptomyces sp. NPDC090073]|uniref:(2Fe-2S)-binding protein n=1 Tax=Streptomyces sp. NPDC090073 TaxID=3365936 RepID=UPI003825AC04